MPRLAISPIHTYRLREADAAENKAHESQNNRKNRDDHAEWIAEAHNERYEIQAMRAERGQAVKYLESVIGQRLCVGNLVNYYI